MWSSRHRHIIWRILLGTMPGTDSALAGDKPAKGLIPHSEIFSTALADAFVHLRRYERDFILEHSEQLSICKYEIVIAEKSPKEAIYIVASGNLRVEKIRTAPSGEVKHVELARLGPGALFGEMSFLTNDGADATISASEATEVLYIKSSLIKTLMDTVGGFDGRFYRSLATLLSNQLRTKNNRVAWH